LAYLLPNRSTYDSMRWRRSESGIVVSSRDHSSVTVGRPWPPVTGSVSVTVTRRGFIWTIWAMAVSGSWAGGLFDDISGMVVASVLQIFVSGGFRDAMRAAPMGRGSGTVVGPVWDRTGHRGVLLLRRVGASR
jgi:hypothetical protein